MLAYASALRVLALALAMNLVEVRGENDAGVVVDRMGHSHSRAPPAGLVTSCFTCHRRRRKPPTRYGPKRVFWYGQIMQWNCLTINAENCTASYL